MFFHVNDVPSGLQDFPGHGWPLFANVAVSDPAPVRIGSETSGFDLPETFHSTIQPTDATGRPLDNDWILTLLFQANPADSEILIAGALAGGGELTDVLDKVRSARPLRWWQRRATMQVVSEVSERAAAHLFYENDPSTGERQTADAASLWTREKNGAAHTHPLGHSKRMRVNRTLLEEVARVYREAWESGVSSPTKVVAAHFHRPRSTAAKWVSRARQEGVLGPADGPRGGER